MRATLVRPSVGYRAVRLAAPARRVSIASRCQAAAPRGGDGQSMASSMALGGLAILTGASMLLSTTVGAAQAADLALGAQVFNGNCAACHQGGNNSVIPGHGLHKEEIEQFLDGGFNLEAIVYQVENGKGAMPAWEGTLDPDEIQAVAEYVYSQASNNSW